MTNCRNTEIKTKLKEAGVFQYELAEAMGVSEFTLVKRLRKEQSAEEKERIAQLGERLGYLDREMQLRQLSLYESEFERMIQKAKETAPAKKKLYHSLGVFGGAMLAILFW